MGCFGRDSPWNTEVGAGLQRLICFGTSVGDDVINITVQYPAEVIDGGGAQRFILAQAVNGGT